MIDSSQFPKYNFFSSWAFLDEMYPMMFDRDTFLEKAWYAWKKIGNKYSYLHVYEAEVPEDGVVEIPDNVETIETVTSNSYFYNDYVNRVSGSSIFIYRNGSQLTQISSLDKPVIDNEIYNKIGPFVNYELHGTNILHFDKSLYGMEVCIIYSGIISDEDCNPMITFKEAEAIAYQVAYVEFRRKASMGDKNASNMIQIARQEADNAMSAATIPEQLSENFNDQVLNEKFSFDRKIYNKNYKFRK